MNTPTPLQPRPLQRKQPDPASTVYGRVPPQALELEENVLGVIMLEREKLDEVLRIIRNEDCFYTDAHQKIYRAVLQLNAKGSPVDLLTVTDALRKNLQLEAVGGAYYLTRLTTNVVNSAKVEAHARIVMEKFIQREIIRISATSMAAAYEDSTDVFDLLDQVQVDFGGINDSIRTGNIKHFGASVLAAIREMAEQAAKGDVLLGLSTGLTKLDRITDGLTPPDLITLAAGTGEGKTTLALNIALHIARTSGPVGFFSLEMRDRQLVWKVISGELREDVKSIRRGNFSSEKWHRLNTDIAGALMKLGIYMYDKGGVNIIELKAIARTMRAKYGIRILFIDYIQLVRGAGKKFGTREEEVNFISKELKSLAMELDMPIVALSQLNRIEKQNAKRMYRLSDLRESGAIEQDSDGVIFIYRPTLHEQNEMNIGGESMYFTDTDALIDIAKWRLGETGTFRVRFDGPFNKFSDYDVLYSGPAAPDYEPTYSPGLVSAGRHVVDFSQHKAAQETPVESDDLPF